MAPGPPFSGSATFAKGQLTGDLTASFLGLPDPVSLAPANATLTQEFVLEPPEGCGDLLFKPALANVP